MLLPKILQESLSMLTENKGDTHILLFGLTLETEENHKVVIQ